MKAKLAAAVLLLALPCLAQTAAELLQKGIYAQETEGNLDNAIQIYRQVVNSAPPREVGAQAQYRLAQSLLQKGDLTQASAEFDRLARDYSDYGNLVSSLAGQVQPGTFRFNVARSPTLQQAERVAELQARLAALRTRFAPDHPAVKDIEAQIQDLKKALAQTQGDLFSGEFDMTKTTMLTGKVVRAEWINPRAWIWVETSAGVYQVQLASPNQMVKSGMTRNTFQLGMGVTVTGAPAKDGSMTVQATTILSDGKQVFDRTGLAPAPNAQ